MAAYVDPSKLLKELESKFDGVTDPMQMMAIAAKELVRELIHIRTELTTIRLTLQSPPPPASRTKPAGRTKPASRTKR